MHWSPAPQLNPPPDFSFTWVISARLPCSSVSKVTAQLSFAHCDWLQSNNTFLSTFQPQEKKKNQQKNSVRNIIKGKSTSFVFKPTLLAGTKLRCWGAGLGQRVCAWETVKGTCLCLRDCERLCVFCFFFSVVITLGWAYSSNTESSLHPLTHTTWREIMGSVHTHLFTQLCFHFYVDMGVFTLFLI